MDAESKVTNLSPWPDERTFYHHAYRLLERMAASGHVTMGFDMGHSRGRGVDGRPLPLNGCCHPSQEMRDLIAALGRGDEEFIKRVLLDDLQKHERSDAVLWGDTTKGGLQ